MADQTAPAGDELTERYEQLRRAALGRSGHADGFRHGLGVLTSRGMAAWSRACGPGRPVPAPPPAAPTSRPTWDAFTSEVVAVLAQMTLAHV